MPCHLAAGRSATPCLAQDYTSSSAKAMTDYGTRPRLPEPQLTEAATCDDMKHNAAYVSHTLRSKDGRHRPMQRCFPSSMSARHEEPVGLRPRGDSSASVSPTTPDSLCGKHRSTRSSLQSYQSSSSSPPSSSTCLRTSSSASSSSSSRILPPATSKRDIKRKPRLSSDKPSSPVLHDTTEVFIRSTSARPRRAPMPPSAWLLERSYFEDSSDEEGDRAQVSCIVSRIMERGMALHNATDEPDSALGARDRQEHHHGGPNKPLQGQARSKRGWTELFGGKKRTWSRRTR